MTNQLPGQMALFAMPGTISVCSFDRVHPVVTYHPAEPWPELDQLCDVCGAGCTSSKECVELAGDNWEQW